MRTVAFFALAVLFAPFSCFMPMPRKKKIIIALRARKKLLLSALKAHPKQIVIALAVLADAFYEGYREHIRDAGRRSAKPETQDAQPARSRAEESSQEKRRAA